MVQIKVKGSATLRKGTMDYKRWQIVESDGETAVDLTNATSVVLQLKDENDGTISEFSTADGSPILFLIGPLTDGIVELRPASDTFDTVTAYMFHFTVIDSVGPHPVPEDRDERLRIIDNYPVP